MRTIAPLVPNDSCSAWQVPSSFTSHCTYGYTAPSATTPLSTIPVPSASSAVPRVRSQQSSMPTLPVSLRTTPSATFQ
ncbi:MAG: hypothetical protein CVU56_02380 [Deltaproteobacteria bacterium HGW-Deltaproteobacteria-14]|nr:MAG: hypothetical protein CVU56_02380 [Deltaproteobacteria bacterium HGW-Deltaproteobacteria-14]